MDALEAIRTRHSTRSFVQKPISKETLEAIVDAGRWGPTARNEQPWEFVLVTQPEALKRIAFFTDYGRFIMQASACVAVFCKDTKYYLEDGCCATVGMMVAATALGVQSCWVAGDKKPYAESIRKLLEVPEGHKLVSLVVLGHEDKQTPRARKRGLQEVLHWETYRASAGSAG